MKLLAITAPYFFVEEDKIITSLFEEGLDSLHIYKPNATSTYIERLLLLIPSEYHQHIVIHDHFYLKEEFGLKGIHLNAEHPREPDNYKGHISCSCSSVEEVVVEKRLCDYVFMGPIFDGISTDSEPIFTPEEIRLAAIDGIIDGKVIAKGGVSIDNIDQIRDYGFGGAAFLGDLWNKFDIHSDRNINGVLEHFKKIKAIAG
ncbi:MAG: thiamine phosphate synthase [Bacteroidaceae bacterium]|nr:thiamine phosphate synthase [Bacteroidaceae bacterium]